MLEECMEPQSQHYGHTNLILKKGILSFQYTVAAFYGLSDFQKLLLIVIITTVIIISKKKLVNKVYEDQKNLDYGKFRNKLKHFSSVETVDSCEMFNNVILNVQK